MRFLRTPEVLKRYNTSSSALYRWMAEGFPKPVKLVPGLKNSPNGWLEEELDDYDRKLIEARDTGAKA